MKPIDIIKEMTKPENENFCLYCGAKLDFIPVEDGGFCCGECEDKWMETGGHPNESED